MLHFLKKITFIILYIHIFFSYGFSQVSPLTNDEIILFQRAETYFHEGKFIESRQIYEEFIQKYPQSSRSSKSIFRLGQIDFKNQSYSTALRSFKLFSENYPSSSWIYHAKLKIAQCYFWLERYQEAESLLMEALKANPDIGQKWQAQTFLGMIADKKEDFNHAIELMKKVVAESTNANLKNIAQNNIEVIVNQKLNKEQLIALIEKYDDEYPADQALIRLISIYRSNRNIIRFDSTLQTFIEKFPNHNLTPEYEKVLANQNENENRRILQIGVVLPLSGNRALVGQQVLQGIQLAFNRLSLQERSRFALKVKDSGLGQSVQKIVKELSQNPNVVGIIGPVFSKDIQDIISIIEEYELPVFSPTASTSGLADLSPFVFRNALTKEVQATFLARHAINDLGLHRFMVVYPDTSYGETMKEVFVKEVIGLGGHVVDSLPYKRSQNDFKDLIFHIGGASDQQLKSKAMRYLRSGRTPPELNDKGNISRPAIDSGLFSGDEVEGLNVGLELNYDAIFIPGYYDKISLLAPQLVFYNIENVLLLGGNGWNSQELIDNARNYLKSVLFVDGFFAESSRPETQEFVEKYETNFGERPSVLAAQAYDTSNIFIKLLKEGADSRLKIKTGLEVIRNFSGVTGNTSIKNNGDSEKSLVRLTVEDGEIVVLGEEENKALEN